MDTISTATLGHLIPLASQLSTTILRELLLQSNVFDVSGLSDSHLDSAQNKSELLLQPLLKAQRKAAKGGTDAHTAVIEFITLWLRRRGSHNLIPGASFRIKIEPLLESLRSDGYELDLPADGEPRLLPTGSSAVPLTDEITALTTELADRGYTEALENYNSAVRALRNNEYEAANSRTRTALESLLMSLATHHTGFTATKAGQGRSALQSLVKGQPAQGVKYVDSMRGEPLEHHDGGQLVEGFWEICHTNGAHPGRSNAREARMRLGMMTYIALYLLDHFPHRE
ncbi:hypothetical protein [Nocardia thailandica]|uniref:hypothetical protein n=1 Tax=Nocardia thailandica TaxID=257275 RepID=UPI0002DF5A01|nr:hypothetical protein [Nocardia thailandica]